MIVTWKYKEENGPSLCHSDSDIVRTDSESENFDFDVIEMDGTKFDFLNKLQNLFHPIYSNVELTVRGALCAVVEFKHLQYKEINLDF